MFLNTTVEERVSLLEIQVNDLDQDVNFLFDEQAIQDERLLNHDERLFSLEQTSLDILGELDSIEDELESESV